MTSTTTTTTTSKPSAAFSTSYNGSSEAADEQHFLNAVMAAGGSISHNVPSTTNEADISVNEDMFLPSMAAAVAVTLSPSFGPSSLPSDFSFPSNEDYAGNWQRKDIVGGSSGLALPSLPSLETAEDYQLRVSMLNGMNLGASSLIAPPKQQQPVHQQRYDASYMYYDQQPTPSAATSTYAFPQQAFRYDQGANAAAPYTQRYQQQQHLAAAPVPQHMMYYQQQNFGDYAQQNPYSSSRMAPMRQGRNNSLRQQQQPPTWASYDDVYSQPQQQQQQHAIPTQAPRSTLVEELRAAIRASNNNMAIPNNSTQARAIPQQQRSRPGYMPAPQQQQQQQQMNNAMLMANQAPLVNIPFTLSDIRGHAVELAQDQYGSRWLQQQLCSMSVSAADKQRLFAELLPSSFSLASDTFGNYCVQILLNPTVGTPEQQRQLCVKAFEGNIVELSRNTYACRCIQSLVKLFQLGDSVIPIHLQDKMLRELEPNILTLVTDSNANHVCQQVIERIRPIHRIEFILNAFKGNYVQLAKDPFGCRVCQRVLEHATEEFVEPALEELLEQMDNLVTDSMGNYVVQHIITAYSGDRYLKQRTRLVNCVKSKLLQFATHKFASNVVEKVLEYGDPSTRREVIQMMLETPPGGGVSMLQIMMSDLFANYVCQRSLAVADRDQLVRLVQVVRHNANELRRMTYGKHILAACDKAAMAAGIQ